MLNPKLKLVILFRNGIAMHANVVVEDLRAYIFLILTFSDKSDMFLAVIESLKDNESLQEDCQCRLNEVGAVKTTEELVSVYFNAYILCGTYAPSLIFSWVSLHVVQSWIFIKDIYCHEPDVVGKLMGQLPWTLLIEQIIMQKCLCYYT